MQSQSSTNPGPVVVKNYVTPEYTDVDRERAKDWIERYGWHTACPSQSYTWVGKCGAGPLKLGAKNRGYLNERPMGHWKGTDWIDGPANTAAQPARRRTGAPKINPISPVVRNLEASYQNAVANWTLVKAEVEMLRGLLAAKGVQVVGPLGLGRVVAS